MSMGITSNIAGASNDVINAIKKASVKTGVDFDYLVNQARTESSFRTDVKAKTSSATGLYQFIDQTWLGMVSKHGSRHGMEKYSDAIQQDFQGRFFVSDDTLKKEILNLRTDPEISSIMAAEFASDNQKYLESKTGKDINQTDLYLAHFLGAGGASKYINAMQSNPNRPAAELLPSAANANKNIFYNSNGSKKSLNQIYNHFQAKFNDITPAQTAKVDVTPAVDKSYRRDIMFERMYGNGVQDFVRDMPSIDGFVAGNYFEGLFGEDIGSIMQNRVKNQSLFLTLTMLDLPK